MMGIIYVEFIPNVKWNKLQRGNITYIVLIMGMWGTMIESFQNANSDVYTIQRAVYHGEVKNEYENWWVKTLQIIAVLVVW